MSKNKKLNLYGVFKVKTEGDCEGKSMKNLGVFKGDIIDIALFLRDQSYYKLYFENYIEPFEPTFKNYDEIIGKSVNFSYEAFTKEELEEAILFKHDDIEVDKDAPYCSWNGVGIRVKSTDDYKRDIALAKLTAEEKALLGLV